MLCDVGIKFQFHEHHILRPAYSKPMTPHLKLDPNVIVFSLFPGIQDGIVRHVLESPSLRGIVMRTFGSGNAPHAPWVMRLLDEAAHRGVNIVNISQCLTGSVEMERYGTFNPVKTVNDLLRDQHQAVEGGIKHEHHHSGLRQADDTPSETRPERDRVQSLSGHPGQHRAPRDGIAGSARHRDAYLR